MRENITMIEMSNTSKNQSTRLPNYAMWLRLQGYYWCWIHEIANPIQFHDHSEYFHSKFTLILLLIDE